MTLETTIWNIEKQNALDQGRMTAEAARNKVERIKKELAALEKETALEAARERVRAAREKVESIQRKIRDLEQQAVTQEKKVEVKTLPPTIEQSLVADLSPEERVIVVEAMKTATPMEFEPPEVKTDITTFVTNQVVRSTSGFKIPKSMERTVRRLRNKTLLGGTAIMTLWTSISAVSGRAATVKPEKVRGDVSVVKIKEIEKKEEVKETPIKIKEAQMDMPTFNQLSPNAQAIYLYAITNIDSTFIIVDKPRAQMYVIGKDKKLVATFPVLLGRMKGERPNIENPETGHAFEATTPAGRYSIGWQQVSEDDALMYRGNMITVYRTDRIGIHETYPPDAKKRTIALNTPTVEDNRQSDGCVNVAQSNFETYLKPNIAEGAVLFVTPDDGNAVLNPVTGKVETKF